MNFDFTKKRPFAARLATYTLAAGAACLTQPAASAAVIYVDPADINILVNTTQILDLNEDATGDFDVTTFADVVPFGNASVNVNGLLSNGVSMSLAAGNTIDGSLTFNPSQTIAASIVFKGLGSFSSSSAVVGLRFNIGADTHYGWMRVAGMADAWAPDANARVFDWAYESSPNTALTAPPALADPYAPTPEPSSIALLALGASGIAALKARRRRQQS